MYFFFTILLLSPLREGLSPSFEKLESPSINSDLCRVWLNLVQYWRNIFINDPSPFYNFVIISTLKKTWPFIWTNLNLFHPRKFVPSLNELCMLVLEKKTFSKISVFLLFRYYLPFEKSDILRLIKIESPSPTDNLY
jgi:hypothetical protein